MIVPRARTRVILHDDARRVWRNSSYIVDVNLENLLPGVHKFESDTRSYVGCGSVYRG